MSTNAITDILMTALVDMNKAIEAEDYELAGELKAAFNQALYEAVGANVEASFELSFDKETILTNLRALFGVEAVGNPDGPTTTNSQPQLADNPSVKVNPKYGIAINKDEVRKFRDPFGGNS